LPLAKTYDVHIVPTVSPKKLLPAAWATAVLGFPTGPREVRAVVEEFSRADIVIDIWGIAFADPLGRNTPLVRAARGVHFLVAKFFHKPVVKYTADFGPFSARWNRLFAKMYLQYTVDLILARSDISGERLERLGVTTPKQVCPDTAFLLEAQTSRFAELLAGWKGDHPVVGFSVSHKALSQSGSPEHYLEAMAALGNYLIAGIGAKVVLIPNEFSDDLARDDLHVAQQVLDRMQIRERVTIMPGGHTAQQQKGIIGQCDALVASRYHTIVAGLSQGIATLAIGWHAKYRSVLELVGQERYVCSVRSLELADLKDKFDDMWQSRESVTATTVASLPGIRQAILAGGEAVGRLSRRRGLVTGA
jgi:polysaccharide pyruvyl transferase WcaK-like protein